LKGKIITLGKIFPKTIKLPSAFSFWKVWILEVSHNFGQHLRIKPCPNYAFFRSLEIFQIKYILMRLSCTKKDVGNIIWPLKWLGMAKLIFDQLCNLLNGQIKSN
jgi:hypothetical protein